MPRTKYLDEYYSSTLIEHLERYLHIELTEDQKYQINRCDRTWLYGSHYRNQERPKPLMRLSFPFYFLWVLCFNFIVQPIKWLFTGSYYLDTKNPIYKFTIDWERKLHL